MELDPDEVRQVQDYFLRRSCLLLCLECGILDEKVLGLFCTGEEPWQIAILPGSPELN